jgi:ketosteroid isomerase-like protein
VLDHAYGVLVTVREGKLARAEWFPDRDAAWAAAGALPQERPTG